MELPEGTVAVTLIWEVGVRDRDGTDWRLQRPDCWKVATGVVLKLLG